MLHFSVPIEGCTGIRWRVGRFTLEFLGASQTLPRDRFGLMSFEGRQFWVGASFRILLTKVSIHQYARMNCITYILYLKGLPEHRASFLVTNCLTHTSLCPRSSSSATYSPRPGSSASESEPLQFQTFMMYTYRHDCTTTSLLDVARPASRLAQTGPLSSPTGFRILGTRCRSSAKA
jgi:hypothetical protein